MIRVEFSRDSYGHKLFDAWLAQAPARVKHEVEVDESKGYSVVFDGVGPMHLFVAWAESPPECARLGLTLRQGRMAAAEIRRALTAMPGPSRQNAWMDRHEIGSWVIAEDEKDEECGQIIAPAHRNERCYRVRFAEGKERVVPAILLEPASPLEILGAQDDDPEDHNPNLDF